MICTPVFSGPFFGYDPVREAAMKLLGKQLFLLAIFFVVQALALAQTVTIDPALLDKANTGNATAQVQAGDSYASGGGQARNARLADESYKQAASWYRKAAEQGSVVGQLRLAALCRDGLGLPRDMVQAATWYRKAAEQGNAYAQATLGLLYSIGQGVPHSDVEAYYWLDLAAMTKGPNQEKYTANRLLIGTHITADEQAAVEERVEAWLAAHPH
jgi:hypothetical protein